MSTSQMIFALWLMILVFSLYAIGRILYQFRTIPADYLIDEKVNWNAKLNPYKVKIYKYFLPIFIFPYYLYYLAISTNNNFDIVFLLSIATIIVSLSYYLLEFKIKSETKSYTQNPNVEPSFVKIFNQLKPSLLHVDEIKKQFDYALEQNYFNCELSQFENLLKLNEPIEKIIWLSKNKNKTSNRRLLLTFVNTSYEGQLDLKADPEVCTFINKYFEFHSSNILKKENPLEPDNVSKWRKTKFKNLKAL